MYARIASRRLIHASDAEPAPRVCALAHGSRRGGAGCRVQR